MLEKIYFDHNASTPVASEVIQAILYCLEKLHGNPSSIHGSGQEAKRQILKVRKQMARFWGVKPQEVFFTSGGTEGLCTVMRGIMENAGLPAHMITSDLEHSSVWKTSHFLKDRGYPVSFLSGGLNGCVDPESVKQAIQPNTRLITLIATNNETGVKTDIEAMAQIAQEANIPLLIDGVCQMGKELFTIPEGVAAYCVSGHKFHAPKGIGATFIRKGIEIDPLLMGNQEYGKRGGTENLAGIVGLGKAVECLEKELPKATEKMFYLQKQFEQALVSKIPEIKINGQGSRTCNTSNLCFPGIDGESLIMNLDLAGLEVSHGSACSSGVLEPSRVLLNMGIPRVDTMNSVRFSMSRLTEEDEVNRAIEIVVQVVQEMQNLKKAYN